MAATRAQKTMRLAAKRAPGTIVQQHRGKPSSRKSFKVWTVSQLLETYRDPRAILLEIAAMDTQTLATIANCSLADALAERRLCAQAVLPYVAQKLPVQVDMRHTRAIVLNIVDDRQYEQLVTLDAEPADNEDGFSMQLISGETTSDSPADAPPQHQERAIQWDIEPGNKGAQRKNVTSIDAVTPPVSAPDEERE